MAEAVAGLLASAVVDITMDKLASAITGQASLLCNFDDDLEYMKKVLETISAALEDAERRSVQERVVQLFLKQLKDVALDISDVLEDYEQDTSDQTAAKIPGALSCIPTAYTKTVMAIRMKSLRKELRKINMVFDTFKFINTQSNSTTNVELRDNRVTTSYSSTEVEGREGEKREIIYLLHESSRNYESGTVIVSIHGLGGMGKTTLARIVFNDDHIQKQYDYRIWVYVSKDFSLSKIGTSIISQLQVQGDRDLIQNTDDLEVIIQCLKKLLCTKKVLIVLDDLWEKDNNQLASLQSMLDVGKKVDVIVTTRDEGIARNVPTSKPYKLQPLKDNICWEIIKRSSQCNPMEFECIGLDIAKKCVGVPLAAQALGYMLRSKGISEWKNVTKSDIWKEKSDSTVLPSLKLSYQRMSPQLRICFSYCAIFSKGHNMVEDDLIHQWSLLGFIQTSKGKEYIKDLLGMSFLQVSQMTSTSQKPVVRYIMHDLVHDLARLTMADQLKIYDVAPPTKTSANKYFRYLLLNKYNNTTKLENMPSKIRALHFSDSAQLNIRNGAFSFARCLRILDFSECSSGVLLPASIGKLKHLRCLIAPRMQNESLPKCITELSKLQYLNLNQSAKISALPDSIGNLGCLKYLCLSGCSGISELPESFGGLKSMVHLDMSGCSRITAVPECITKLSNLRNLNINGSSKITELPESIGNLGCLEYLSLSGCSGISELPESFGCLESMVHLDMSGCSGIKELPNSLGKLMNLQHLDLSGCSSVKEIPEPLCDHKQLLHLDLSSCIRLDQLPEAIGNLMHLQYLNISGCSQIRKLPESLMKLQNLLHLNVSGCHSMQHLGGVRGLTALQHLDMSGLREIYVQDLRVVLPNLTNLKYLSLSKIIQLPWHSFVIEYICRLTNLGHLDLSDSHGIVSLPESIVNLQRLHTLDLSNCWSLRSLPESLGTLGLKSLLLKGCHKHVMDEASSLLNYSQTLPVFTVRADEVNGRTNLHLLEGVHHASELRIYSLENVKSLEETTEVNLSDKHNLLDLTLSWTPSTVREVENLKDKDLLGQLVPPRGLRSICLQGYSCTSFPDWLMCIDRHLTNLVEIEMKDLPKCSSLPPLGQLPHLERLSLINLPGIKRIDGEFCGGKGAFRRLSSFVIRRAGLEEWNTIYSVEDGGEEFMFPVLEKLVIDQCPRLRLKPCPPTFCECMICDSNQVISSLEEVYTTSQHCSSSSRAIKLELELTAEDHSWWKSMTLFHHFPVLRDLHISGDLESMPESMRILTSLESLTLDDCDSISALPEWLGDLSSLKNLVIYGCWNIESLPACIEQLKKLKKLEIKNSPKLKEWCESEENKRKLAHIDVRFVSGW